MTKQIEMFNNDLQLVNEIPTTIPGLGTSIEEDAVVRAITRDRTSIRPLHLCRSSRAFGESCDWCDEFRGRDDVADLSIREITSAFWGLINSRTGKVVAPVRGSYGPALIFQKREEARALKTALKKKYPRRHYRVTKFFGV